MTIIRDVEKARYGKDSYVRLVENGLFVTPKFEGDYSGQAPLSDMVDDGTTDDCETSGGEENNESSTNGVESGMDGLETDVWTIDESDVENAEGAGGVEDVEDDGER